MVVKWSNKLEDRLSAAFAIPGFYRGSRKEKEMEPRILTDEEAKEVTQQAFTKGLRANEELFSAQAALTQKDTRVATLKEVGEWLNSPCDDKGHRPPGQGPCSRRHCWPCMVELGGNLRRGELPK